MNLQGTVRSYDSATRSGAVLLDDGVTLRFDSDAYDVGGLRLLRSGQRVAAANGSSADGSRVTAITLGTFAFEDEA